MAGRKTKDGSLYIDKNYFDVRIEAHVHPEDWLKISVISDVSNGYISLPKIPYIKFIDGKRDYEIKARDFYDSKHEFASQKDSEKLNGYKTQMQRLIDKVIEKYDGKIDCTRKILEAVKEENAYKRFEKMEDKPCSNLHHVIVKENLGIRDQRIIEDDHRDKLTDALQLLIEEMAAKKTKTE